MIPDYHLSAINVCWLRRSPRSGTWSWRLLVKTSTNRNVDNQNVDKPKRRQTETSTNRNVDKPKRRQTETSTNQNVDKPKRRQTKTSTDQNVDRPKRRQTETSTNRNVDKPKRRQTKTSTLGNFCIILKIHCIWYIINTLALTKPLNKRHGEKLHFTAGPQLDHWTYGVDE